MMKYILDACALQIIGLKKRVKAMRKPILIIPPSMLVKREEPDNEDA
jgi:hypothetical protein